MAIDQDHATTGPPKRAVQPDRAHINALPDIVAARYRNKALALATHGSAQTPGDRRRAMTLHRA